MAANSEQRTVPACRRWPQPAGRPPERTRSHSGARARPRAHSMFPEPSETLPSSRGPAELDARVFPWYSGITAHFLFVIACSNADWSVSIVFIWTGGRSTSVTMAASRPRFRTSCRPSRNELNWPRAGSGFTASAAPLAYTTGAKAASFLPATTSTTSTWEKKSRMAAERNVSVVVVVAEPAADGGHGSNALSRPMRVDSPAARITPQKAGVRPMRAR